MDEGLVHCMVCGRQLNSHKWMTALDGLVHRMLCGRQLTGHKWMTG